MTIRVAINGFGRIGRSVLRAWALGGGRNGPHWPEIEIVAINDIADAQTCAYLFEFDSVFGPFPGTVEVDGTHLVVNGRRIRLTMERDTSALLLADVDILMECTGRGRRDVAEAALAAGAGRVLISGPAPNPDLTVVLGGK